MSVDATSPLHPVGSPPISPLESIVLQKQAFITIGGPQAHVNSKPPIPAGKSKDSRTNDIGEDFPVFVTKSLLPMANWRKRGTIRAF